MTVPGRITSLVGSARAIAALGGLYLALAVGGTVTAGGPLGPLSMAVPGVVLLYAGVRLPATDLHRAAYPRIVAWIIGGTGAMLAIVAFVELTTAGLDRPLFSVGLAAAIGSLAGLGIGGNEARALSRAKQLQEEQTRRVTSEQRYRTLVENFPNGAVALVDEDLRYRVAGGTPVDADVEGGDDLEGVSIREAITDELADVLKPRYQAALHGESSTFEYEHAGKHSRFHIVPVRDDDGDVTGAMGMSQDITERREAQQRLETSERRYRTLVESFPDGSVGLFNEELEYTAVGGQLLDQLDITAEERVGYHISELYPDDLVGTLEPRFRAAIAGESSEFDIEYHGRHLRAHTVPVRDGDGDVYAGMLVISDVTSRVETRRELRESEAKFRMLAENLEEVVGMMDANGEELIYVNPAFESVWGSDRAALFDDPTVFLDAVYEADRPRVEAAFDAIPEEVFDEEFRVVRPDGSVRWLHARFRQVEDADSGMVRTVGIGEDITERMERERDLERALGLLEQTERTADVGGWEVDADTMSVYWTDNLLELLDVDDEQPSLEEALAIFHEDDQPAVRETLETALDTGEEFDIETRIRTEGDAVRWLRLQGRAETDDGEVVSVRGAAHDITEHKRREQRLAASNERLEQFAYAVSHDLQEPLRMVSSYVQLLERRYADELDEDAGEFIDYAVDGADRMREMITHLLEYSRVTTRGSPLEPTDAEAVLESVRDDLHLRIEETDATVTADDLPTVTADAEQLGQVFQNLLSNALKYSGDEPPRVHVGAERTGEMWQFTVTDEGVGIDPTHHDRVFELFESAHTDDGTASSGIGLALCERIVDRHGGDIWVESTAGEGATFHFTMPRVTDSQQAVVGHPSPRGDRQPSNE